MVKEIDEWIAEGKFASRSEAIKAILTLYNERERTRKFYQMLSERSDEIRKKPSLLVPIDEFIETPNTALSRYVELALIKLSEREQQGFHISG